MGRTVMASPKVHLLRYAQPSSLRRTAWYGSFLRFRKPCSWSFLLCHSVSGYSVPVNDKVPLSC